MLKHQLPEQTQRIAVNAVDAAGNRHAFAERVDLPDQLPDLRRYLQRPGHRVQQNSVLLQTAAQRTVVKKRKRLPPRKRRRMEIAPRIFQIHMRKRQPGLPAILNVHRIRIR